MKRNLYRAAGVLLLPFAAKTVCAQVAPPIKYGPAISTFFTLTEGKPDFGWYGDLPVYGFTLGGFTESHRMLSPEWRGSILRRGGWDHQETALAGPRVALHYGRFSPYLSLLGGASHSWYYTGWPQKGQPDANAESGHRSAMVGSIGRRRLPDKECQPACGRTLLLECFRRDADAHVFDGKHRYCLPAPRPIAILI